MNLYGVIVREELYFSLHFKIVVVVNVLRAPLPWTKMQFVKHSRLIRNHMSNYIWTNSVYRLLCRMFTVVNKENHFLDHIGYIFIMSSLKADTIVLVSKGDCHTLCLAMSLLAVFELDLFWFNKICMEYHAWRWIWCPWRRKIHALVGCLAFNQDLVCEISLNCSNIEGLTLSLNSCV